MQHSAWYQHNSSVHAQYLRRLCFCMWASSTSSHRTRPTTDCLRPALRLTRPAYGTPGTTAMQAAVHVCMQISGLHLGLSRPFSQSRSSHMHLSITSARMPLTPPCCCNGLSPRNTDIVLQFRPPEQVNVSASHGRSTHIYQCSTHSAQRLGGHTSKRPPASTVKPVAVGACTLPTYLTP